jgi:hypothetical protein
MNFLRGYGEISPIQRFEFSAGLIAALRSAGLHSAWTRAAALLRHVSSA